ncbi:MAG: accessory factor UbiK family protein, partial [Alphaproteobacteria bacterium]|nr:accessory factor UbiK family protein [Alphaproteobacteria bacterium]
MQTENKFFDDLAKLGQSAAGTLHGVKGELEATIKARFEHIFRDMNLVTREEFEVVRDMAREAREKNLELEQKIAALKKNRPTGKSGKTRTTGKTRTVRKA